MERNDDEPSSFRAKFSQWVKQGENGGPEQRVEKKGWCYVKVRASSKFKLKAAKGWNPRYCVASVRLKPDPLSPDDGGGQLEIYRSEEALDQKNLVLRLPLTNIQDHQKSVLEQSEAKLFPIGSKLKELRKDRARDVRERQMDDGAGDDLPDTQEREYRWGHIVFTLKMGDAASSSSPMYTEFCCSNTQLRDSWVEWFMCFLIHQEREGMQRPISPAKLPGKLENSYINKHIKKNFTDHPSSQSGQLEVQDINPCCKLDIDMPPSTTVGWERVRPGDKGDTNETGTKKNIAPRRRIRAKVDHFIVDGRSSMGSSAERIELKFNEYNFVVENQWSNVLKVQHVTNKDIAYKLITDDVPKRDEWLRWLQYAKAIPLVENVLRDRLGWREAALTIRITHARSPKHIDEKKHKCYVDEKSAKLAFKDFPTVKQWEMDTNEAGLRIYKYKNKKPDSDKRGEERRENEKPDKLKVRVAGEPLFFTHAYDLYELFFQPKSVTYPNEPSDEKLAPFVDIWKQATNSPRKNDGPADEYHKRLIRDWLIQRRQQQDRRMSDSEFIPKAKKHLSLPVDYDTDAVVQKTFPAPWDLRDDPTVEYFDDDASDSCVADVLAAATPAVAGRDSLGLPPEMPATLKPPAPHTDPPDTAAPLREANSDTASRTTGSPRSRDRDGPNLLLAEPAPPMPDAPFDAPTLDNGCGPEQVFEFKTNKTGITWADYGMDHTEIYVKAVAVPSVAHSLGIQEGMMLVEVNGEPLTSKDVLLKARAELRKTGKPVVVRLAEGLSQQVEPAAYHFPGGGESAAAFTFPGTVESFRFPAGAVEPEPRMPAPPPAEEAVEPQEAIAAPQELVSQLRDALAPAIRVAVPSNGVAPLQPVRTDHSSTSSRMLLPASPKGTLKLVPQTGIRSNVSDWFSAESSMSTPLQPIKTFDNVSPIAASPASSLFAARRGYSQSTGRDSGSPLLVPTGRQPISQSLPQPSPSPLRNGVVNRHGQPTGRRSTSLAGGDLAAVPLSSVGSVSPPAHTHPTFANRAGSEPLWQSLLGGAAAASPEPYTRNAANGNPLFAVIQSQRPLADYSDTALL